MKRNLWVLLPAVLLATACVPQTQDLAKKRVKVDDCGDVKLPPKCEGEANKNNPVVNVTFTGRGTPKVDPASVCASSGSILTVRLEEHVENGNGKVEKRSPARKSVATLPKYPRDIWFFRTNDVDDKDNPGNSGVIHIDLPTQAGDYDYSILSSKGECADPRVHVD